MARSLDEIQAPIAADIRQFEAYFRTAMSSKVVLLDKIMEYIVKRKGKQIRPMLVFLSAYLFGKPGEKVYRGASLIELLHTATLVHDDVVDDAAMRRGFFSVNALWKNKIAVLVGDYLLSRGLLLSVEHKDFDLLEHVSNAVKEMSEGELLQMEKARRLDISEEVYFNIIRQKTASLIASCCMVGASAGGSTAEESTRMRDFGLKVGMAFQIKDDLFDFGDEEIGKPVGIDIREKKMTLPLIYALGNATSGEKSRIINIVKNHSDEKDKVREVIVFVKQSGGIEYSTQVMERYVTEAIALLYRFEPSIYRDALENLVRFTVERKR